ncbi:MAG TPA: hypothetical protein H9792_04000 [Candidatus Limosilactobacillus excrementigallinarum]|nr:hypothetical protein [Candidatus Limosilactobacillus excrementigallinarum]
MYFIRFVDSATWADIVPRQSATYSATPQLPNFAKLDASAAALFNNPHCLAS